MPKKQLVFIMTDTQRWDMVNCYRETGLATPCLDALAADGVRFERAYTTQPVCGPARAGLFTGTYPSWNGSWANGMALGDNVKTIGQRLTDNGIHCAYIGKWHLDGSDYFGNGRCPEGWDPDYWYDMRTYLYELTEDERVKSRSAKLMKFENVEEGFTYGGRVLRRALDFMERYKDEDYFLVVSFDEPHGPSLSPEPFASMYKDYEFPKAPSVFDTLEGKPTHQKVWADEKGNREKDREGLKISSPAFFGCNSFADHLIGEVVKAAPESAMIMYTSDHGDLLQSHCLFAKGPAPYDEVARIPFIVRHPEGERGTVYTKHPVSHISVCPTVLEFFDIPIPKVLQGESILGACKDTGAEAPELVFFEFTRFEQDHDIYGGLQPMRAVTDGRFKLAINLLSEDELYDMENDPYELKNLIDDPEYAAVRDRLHDAILDRMCLQRDPFRGYYWDNRPWRSDADAPSWKYRGYTRQRENEEYEPRQLDYENGMPMVHAQRPKNAGKKPKIGSLEELIDYLKHYDD